MGLCHKVEDEVEELYLSRIVREIPGVQGARRDLQGQVYHTLGYQETPEHLDDLGAQPQTLLLGPARSTTL